MARSVEKIRQKFGKDAFKKWGNQPDSGSPILKAWREGRVKISGASIRSRSAPHKIIRAKPIRKGKRRATQI